MIVLIKKHFSWFFVVQKKILIGLTILNCSEIENYYIGTHLNTCCTKLMYVYCIHIQLNIFKY